MSTATRYILKEDSNHRHHLFRLPREIQDEIYRLLVKGLYLADKPTAQHDYPKKDCSDSQLSFYDFSYRESDVDTKGELRLSVL